MAFSDPIDTPLLIFGSIIPFVKILIFVPHSKRSAAVHIGEITTQWFQLFNVLISDPSCVIKPYLELVRPKEEDVCPLLLDIANKDFLKLYRIQWKCLRLAPDGMKSTSTLSLKQMANIMPLPERFCLLVNFPPTKILSMRIIRPYLYFMIFCQAILLFPF